MCTDFGFTSLSRGELIRLKDSDLSAEEAFQYLSQKIQIRTFSQTLTQFSPGPDLKGRLTKALADLEPGSPRESVAHKVRDWLADKYAPSGREEYIKLCFALELEEEQAQAFVALSTEGGFHLRNPRELAFAYCLRVGRSYGDALAFIASLPSPDPNAPAPRTPVFTRTVAQAFEEVSDDASFFSFYQEWLPSLGTMHNTAYTCFIALLGLLIKPDTVLDEREERAYSVEEVVEIYLRMNVPQGRNTSQYSALQRTIRRYWPNASSIVRMRTRQEDVSRRALLLLYLVTGGMLPDPPAQALFFEEELSDQQHFEEHYWRLNAMLHDCGMSRLDPRSVFDWLVLYCLKSQGEEAMDQRMQAVLATIFA